MEIQNPSDQWNTQKRYFNHDWLRNRFIVQIGAGLSLTRGDCEDTAFEMRFLGQVLPEWEPKSVEIGEWARSAESMMSPRHRLKERPLNRLSAETRDWLGGVVHEIWLREVPVTEWTMQIVKAIEVADERYRAVKKLLPPNILFGRADIGLALREFGLACEALAETMSRFPSRSPSL